MINKTTILCVLAVLCLKFSAMAQSVHTLKGRVVDDRQQPLPNVTIKIAAQNLAITDKDGQLTTSPAIEPNAC